MNEAVFGLLDSVDLVLLDVKFTDDDAYFRNTGGSFSQTVAFLDELERRGMPVWIRQVVVPGVNDKRENIESLKRLLSGYTVIEKVELLPFRKLCLEKYDALGIPFPFRDTPEMSEAEIKKLYEYLK